MAQTLMICEFPLIQYKNPLDFGESNSAIMLLTQRLLRAATISTLTSFGYRRNNRLRWTYSGRQKIS
jgi:hypothetical protein